MAIFTLVFGLGFASPAMLGWLAVAAVPILLHLWSKSRYREVPWAAMEYLLDAVRRSSCRVQFENWLLLLIRTLLVALIVLAVAGPFFAGSGPLPVTNGRTHCVIVIDGSYSMDYVSEATTNFERAKELAIEIVENSLQGNGFSLVLMSFPPRVIVGNPTSNRSDFIREIRNLALPQTTIDVPKTLVLVEELLIEAQRESPRFVNSEVYFFTDMCRVGWKPNLARQVAKAEFQERARRLADAAALVLVDLGAEDAGNMAVSNLRATTPLATIGQAVDFEVELRNFGAKDRKGQLVECLADGVRVMSRRVDLAAGGTSSLKFSHRFETPGGHAIEARLEKDRLEIDNHRWLSLPVRQHIKALCVDGRPSGESFGGATRYLTLALAPRQGAGDTRVLPKVVSESVLLELDLADFDCIFVCDVAQFTANEVSVLQSYLETGGGLVFFLGEQVLANRYNEELAGQSVDILPARLGPIVDRRQTRLDPLGYAHRIVEPFRGSEQAGLLTTPVDKYFKLDLSGRLDARIVLAFADGDPMIVESEVRRGRVVLVATSADTSWTPMPLWPSYVPILQEILAYAMTGRSSERNVLVGQEIGASISGIRDNVELFVESPGGDSRKVRLRLHGDYAEWSYGDTLISGVYITSFGSPVFRNELFAVNVDTLESELTRLTLRQFRENVWPGVPFVYKTGAGVSGRQPAGRIGTTLILSKSLLYSVLVLLFFEIFFAWRFGYNKI